MEKYSFISRWRVKASIGPVWDAIYETSSWPSWWKGIEEVNEIGSRDPNGMRQIVFGDSAPVPVKYNLTVSRVEKYRCIEFTASGEYKGKAKWLFEEQPDGTILIQYHWQVSPRRTWKNMVSPVSRTLMQWNHDMIMEWGAKGLSQKVNAGLIEY